MQLPSSVRARLRKAMFAQYGTVCHLRLAGCEYRATEADHVRSAHTHGHGLDNLRPACKPCNVRKGEPESLSDPAPLVGGW